MREIYPFEYEKIIYFRCKMKGHVSNGMQTAVHAVTSVSDYRGDGKHQHNSDALCGQYSQLLAVFVLGPYYDVTFSRPEVLRVHIT